MGSSGLFIRVQLSLSLLYGLSVCLPGCDCSVREFMTFTSDLLVERTDVGGRQSVKEQGEWGG